MEILNYSTEKVVIITNRARTFISSPVQNSCPIIETGDITATINDLRSGAQPVPLLAVLFLMVGEYSECNKLLSVLPFSHITYQLVLFGAEQDVSEFYCEDFRDISEFRTSRITGNEFSFIVKKALSAVNDLFITRAMQENYLSRMMDMKQDQDDLINIGRALSIEKDPDRLLRQILFLSKKITGADAGSIYLVEEDGEGRKRLRFKYSHTFSREIPLEEFVMPMDKKSIAGYVAVTGEVLNISDVYQLHGDAPYSFNASIDQKYQYRSRSVLTVPMRNHTDEIIGVIQLLNSKEDLTPRGEFNNEAFSIRLENMEDFERYVVSFEKKYDSLMEAVAGQAAIAIENNRMIIQIQHQFEEFVKASVTAIESRDPATSGHSFRVAALCTAMARAVNEAREGYLAQFKFSDSDIRELELAALLHDFGKVYIDLAVFQKAKKLYPRDFDNLVLRLNYLYRFLELQYAARELETLRVMGKNDDAAAAMNRLVEEKNGKLQRIREIKQMLSSLNEPTVQDDDPEEALRRIIVEIHDIECVTIEGDRVEVISENDVLNLTIRRGSLNSLERSEIESHVVHTYSFVSKIPWPPEYRRIPEIALRHHEKLNGTGYPGHLMGRESTLIQARIMSIADIYDALAASDRPYKKAVPLDRVVVILRSEAQAGVLDPDLVELFIERRIYESAQGVTLPTALQSTEAIS